MKIRRTLRFLATLMMVVTVGVLIVPRAASADIQGRFFMTPYSWSTYGCLGVRGNSSSSGAQLEQQHCNYNPYQLWYFENNTTTGHYWRIYSAANVNLCMNVQNASSTAANIIQYPCGKKAASPKNDQWAPELIGSYEVGPYAGNYADYYLLHSLNNYNMCLNIEHGGTTAGAKLIQYACNRNSQNEWFTWVNV